MQVNKSKLCRDGVGVDSHMNQHLAWLTRLIESPYEKNHLPAHLLMIPQKTSVSEMIQVI